MGRIAFLFQDRSTRVLGGLVKQILGMDTDVVSVDSPVKQQSFACG